MDFKPLVSVVMPAYNASKTILGSIESVLSQSFKSLELIVVDDCSNEDLERLLKPTLSSDSRLRFVRLERNYGAAFARNIAIELAVGRYIAFLDSDDLWFPNKIETQISFMCENDVAFSYSAYEKIDENGKTFGVMGVSERISYTDLLKTCSIGCLTAIYDTNKVGKIYMPINTKREDFGTWLMILKKVDYAYGVNEVLAQYRVYDSQTSSKKTKMAKENWRLYRDVEKLGLLKSVYYFSHYAIRGVLRTKFPRLARLLGVLQ